MGVPLQCCNGIHHARRAAYVLYDTGDAMPGVCAEAGSSTAEVVQSAPLAMQRVNNVHSCLSHRACSVQVTASRISKNTLGLDWRNTIDEAGDTHDATTAR
jgi:hypothetical protein